MSWNLKLNYIQKEKDIWSKQRLMLGSSRLFFGMSISTAVSITKSNRRLNIHNAHSLGLAPQQQNHLQVCFDGVWNGKGFSTHFMWSLKVDALNQPWHQQFVASSTYPESDCLRIPENGDLIHIIFRFQLFVFSGGESQALIQQKDVR